MMIPKSYDKTSSRQLLGVSYEGITIDCNAPAPKRKESGMDLREVGRDTSRRLLQL